MSFLRDYRDFCSGLEAPPTFNVYCALYSIAALTGRRVWITVGDYFRIYPNLYVILVGPPGCGKNTTMEIAEELLHEYKLPMSAESVTREKLILDIQAQEQILEFLPPTDKYRIVSPYNILATELSEFLGAGGLGMISFLTDIYSRNLYEYRTKNKGSVFVRGPFLNLIAGTTPDWITTYLKDDIISGGFSRRAIFIYETGRIGRIAFPKVTPEMSASWQRVVARGHAIRKLAGQFKWHDTATTFYKRWYENLQIPTDPNLVGYFGTKHIQTLKVAMLVAMSEGDDLVLHAEHIRAALDLLAIPEANLGRVFQGIGRNELNAASIQAMDMLMKAPTMKLVINGHEHEVQAMRMKQFKAFLWKFAKSLEINDIVQHLVDSDKAARCVSNINNTEYIYVKPRD